MSSSSEASLSPGDESDIEDFGNKTPAEKFRYQFQLIQKMRSKKDAPVDTMGCFSLHDRQAEPRVQRFQIFVSLLLSPRTRDEKTSVAVQNLRKEGLTIERIIATPLGDIERMISMVGMWKQKAKYLKDDAVVLRDKFDSDIPNSFKALTSLDGVGPKIASLTLMHCHNSTEYIGVDTHVHRISNRLWINTTTPEQTETQLKKIVPKSQWRDVGVALVGFGQTICKATPKCDQCLLRPTCPVADTFMKKKKK